MTQKPRIVLGVLVAVVVSATAYAKTNALPPECRGQIAEANREFCKEAAEVVSATTRIQRSFGDLQALQENASEVAEDLLRKLKELGRQRRE